MLSKAGWAAKPNIPGAAASFRQCSFFGVLSVGFRRRTCRAGVQLNAALVS